MHTCIYNTFYRDIYQLSDDTQVKAYHLFVNDHKWQELVKQDDLRFFKHNRNIITDLKKQKANGVILKMCNWNSNKLKNAYTVSKQFKHMNFVKYMCYFEYEEDIIHFLLNCSDTVLEDVYSDNAIVIIPGYKNILSVKPTNIADIIIQIILSLYYALYCHHISFIAISIDDIYVDDVCKLTNIKYEFNGFMHKLQTKYIVKLDIYKNSNPTRTIKVEHYRELYDNILSILKDLHAKDELIDFIQEFVSQTSDTRIVCPMKVIDTILSNVRMYYTNA